MFLGHGGAMDVPRRKKISGEDGSLNGFYLSARVWPIPDLNTVVTYKPDRY